ncbi:MAG: hypothetical protein A2Z14_01860 [Chloroflexi bacterium RBG_16_48_8]|nr:MAG: hypothetical protein A2Z14_01860 [Chloroflexi bacterium RBG_16_48_8]
MGNGVGLATPNRSPNGRLQDAKDSTAKTFTRKTKLRKILARVMITSQVSSLPYELEILL